MLIVWNVRKSVKAGKIGVMAPVMSQRAFTARLTIFDLKKHDSF